MIVYNENFIIFVVVNYDPDRKKLCHGMVKDDKIAVIKQFYNGNVSFEITVLKN